MVVVFLTFLMWIFFFISRPNINKLSGLNFPDPRFFLSLLACLVSRDPTNICLVLHVETGKYSSGAESLACRWTCTPLWFTQSCS